METKTIRLVLLAALVSACASPEIEKPVGPGGYLGVGLCPADGGIQVVRVNSDSPARKAGIKTGDILTEYDGQSLAGLDNRKVLMWDMRTESDRKLPLKIKRGDKTVTAKPVTADKPYYPKDELYAVLSDEIVSGRKVTVAVVVTQVDHTKPEFFDSAQALETWKAGMRNSVENRFESLMLNKNFTRCGNYAVADRAKTDQVLKELGFHMTGAVSPETTKEVGKMLGASHILFVSFTRYTQPSGGYEDDSNVRLVAVESDSVLASLRFRSRVDHD